MEGVRRRSTIKYELKEGSKVWKIIGWIHKNKILKNYPGFKLPNFQYRQLESFLGSNSGERHWSLNMIVPGTLSICVEVLRADWSATLHFVYSLKLLPAYNSYLIIMQRFIYINDRDETFSQGYTTAKKCTWLVLVI